MQRPKYFVSFGTNEQFIALGTHFFDQNTLYFCLRPGGSYLLQDGLNGLCYLFGRLQMQLYTTGFGFVDNIRRGNFRGDGVADLSCCKKGF